MVSWSTYHKRGAEQDQTQDLPLQIPSVMACAKQRYSSHVSCYFQQHGFQKLKTKDEESALMWTAFVQNVIETFDSLTY